jgi:PE family protein
MSFQTTHPAALTAAVNTLQALGHSMAAQNAAATAPTTGVVPAAADQISALQATQFAAYGAWYQQVSAHAKAIHEMLVSTLEASADSYGDQGGQPGRDQCGVVVRSSLSGLTASDRSSAP